MRAAEPPIYYLVGTPKGRLSKLEKEFLKLPWEAVRDAVEVKLLDQEGELYVLARSVGRADKERAMRRRRLKKLLKRLRELQGQTLNRDRNRSRPYSVPSYLPPVSRDSRKGGSPKGPEKICKNRKKRLTRFLARIG